MEEAKDVPEAPAVEKDATVDVDEKAATTESGGDCPTIEDLAAELAEAEAERDKALAEKSELMDRLMRRQAEFENYRRRAEREKGEIWEKASMETVRAVLPVVDDFERALQTPCADAEYVRGTELIFQRLMDSLGRAGLEPIIAEGAKFDPNLHQALDTQVTEEQEEDTVLQVYQKGYKFKGTLLRAAMVKVAARPQ